MSSLSPEQADGIITEVLSLACTPFMPITTLPVIKKLTTNATLETMHLRSNFLESTNLLAIPQDMAELEAAYDKDS